MGEQKRFKLETHSSVEGCVIKPRSLVVLVDRTSVNPEYHGTLEYNSQLNLLPYDQYSLVAVVPWHLDVYFCHLGRMVQKRIDGILKQAFKTAVIVANQNWNQIKLRTKNLYSVFRATVRSLRRYYEGCFLTERFQELLHGVMQDIARWVKAYRQSLLKPILDQSVSEFVN